MRFLLVCVSILLSTVSNAQFTKTLQLENRLQQKLDSLQKANGFPGATFAAVFPDGTEILIATGTADSLHQTPMKPDHRMLSASIGKTFFAVAAISLADQGKFDLDDLISKYLGTEAWFKRIPNADSITIRMLMNHTSGIEEYYELGDFMEQLQQNPDKVWKPVETIAYIFDRKPLFPAGSAFGYADANYLILGYLIEKLTGKSMYNLAYTYALKPNHLSNTEPSIKRKLNKLATGYSRSDSPFPFHGAMIKDNKLVFSPQFEWTGGGFISNSLDLARWSKELYYLKSVSAAMRKEMQMGVKANTGKDHLYGLGIQIRPMANFGMGYGHSGWYPGYVSDCEYFPELNIAVAIQFNTDDRKLLKKSTQAYLLEMLELIQKSK